MSTVRRTLALAAVVVAIATPAATATAAPAQTTLWQQHSVGHGQHGPYTSGAVTIPATSPGAATTAWEFHYTWHCANGAYASPQVTYTTGSSTQPVGVVVDEWARNDQGAMHLERMFPAGQSVTINWRMDIGRAGQAPGSGGLCSHTFRITQAS